jgi:micrococcal nuclease
VTVIDGDTVVLRVKNKTETVRLIGIDTPETVHPSKPVECFGPEASSYISQLLPTDTEVRVVRDVEARDYYNRLLLYIFRASDGLFINKHMVETGHATPMPYPPNITYSREFAAVGHSARAANVGLWGACSR